MMMIKQKGDKNTT